MFGFLHPPPKHRLYRQAYARCCSMQKREFGLRSLPFVSYEAVFMYCLAVDLGWIPALGQNDPTCCKMRSPQTYRWTASEIQAARFSANFALLLAKTKLDDDVFDGRSLIANSYRFALRRPIRKMQTFFADGHPGYLDSLTHRLADHQSLERSGAHMAIGPYVMPTANAFRDAFSAFCDACSEGNESPTESHSEVCREVGQCIGAALIAFDCAVDWRRDRKRGDFNPLGSHSEVDGAMAFAIQQLVQAGWMIAQTTPGRSITAEILQHRVHVIAQKRRAKDGGESPRRSSRVALARAGFCDCDCDCGCIDCDCCCDCASFSPHCDCCCYESCKNTKEENNEATNRQTEQPQQLLGKNAVATTVLTPFGTVEVNGETFAAKSEFGVIEQGAEVVVIAKEPFGLLVRAAGESAET